MARKKLRGPPRAKLADVDVGALWRTTSSGLQIVAEQLGPQSVLWPGETPLKVEAFQQAVMRVAEAEENAIRRATDAEAAEGRKLHRQHRQGRRSGYVPWHAVVRAWHEGGLTFPEIWAHARRLLAEAERLKATLSDEQMVIVAVVENSADPSCNVGDDAHPRGPHWHCRNRRGRIVPVAAGRIKNFITDLRRRK
jgi:hypothetical protein